MILFVFQQLTGINALLYYAPEILKDVRQDPGMTVTSNVAVLVSMGVNCLFSFVPVFLIDRIGRRGILCGGALGMAFIMGALSLLGSQDVVWNGSGSTHPHMSTGAQALRGVFGSLMLAFVGCFASSWGVVVWACLGELVPLRW